MAESVRILIADDHRFVREGIAAVLNREKDLEVVGQACDGSEAVSQASKLRPDIILMDLQMPGVDGVEAIRQIREQDPNASIVILTMFDTDDYIFRGIEAGARAYVLKDASSADVLEAIRALHRGASVIESTVATRLMDRFCELSRAQAPAGALSPREMEVLKLMAEGSANKEIAEHLYIEASTVKTHTIHIFKKLGVKRRSSAVAEAVKRGIIRL